MRQCKWPAAPAVSGACAACLLGRAKFCVVSAAVLEVAQRIVRLQVLTQHCDACASGGWLAWQEH
jgi:hypothetical protein